ncbi:hypothetical protein CFQ52_21160 [Salmonella enterica]|nr:hypothetical protein [Salmonella enterica]EBS8537941.1 hypothetical protein [Salmonella enterica]
MLDKFLVLLERFVVAHELIAANSAKQPATVTVANNTTKPVEIKVEGEDVIDTKPAKAKSEPEDDLDDEELEEKPKQKRTRGQSIKAAAEATKPKGPDVAKLREEIKTKAQAIGVGDSDDVADALEALLDKFNSRTVIKLKDEQVQDFAEGLQPIYIDLLRFENGQMATAMKKTEGADEFNDLLDKYDVSRVKDLPDADVETFHGEAKKLVSKYYDIED